MLAIYLALFFVGRFLIGVDPAPTTNPLCPEHGTEEWRQIVLTGTKATLCYRTVMDEYDKICGELAESVMIRGFIVDREITEGCAHACGADNEQAVKICAARLSPAGGNWTFSVLIEYIRVWTETPRDIPADVIDTWWILARRLWPLTLSIVPVILQQWKYYNFIGATGLMVLYGFIMSFVSVTTPQKMYLFVTCGACLFNSGTHGIVAEVMGGMFTLGVFVCVSFLTDPIYQLATVIAILMAYVAWLMNSFVTKRSGSAPGAVVSISLIFVLHEQIWLLRQDYKLFTVSMSMLEMTLNAIIPCGSSSFYLMNIIKLGMVFTDQLVAMFPVVMPASDQILIILLLIQIIMSICFKALFGMFVITSMRYKMTWSNFFKGFLIYMCDLFSGMSYSYKVVFGIVRYDARRLLYSCANVAFFLCELYYARDLLYLRGVFWFVDEFISDTKYGSLPKYLRCDMNFSDFPQKGSHPWLALDKIFDITKHVVRLYAGTENGLSKGLGFLLDDGNKVKLATVHHVVADSTYVAIDANERLKIPVIDDLLDDPVYIVPILFDSGARVSLLTPDDVPNVTSLFFVKWDDGIGPSLSYVTKFKFDKDFNILASVDLSYGDSGGPVFAVLKNSNVRYAGCTSSGNPDVSGGNYISCVLADVVVSDAIVTVPERKKKCSSSTTIRYDSSSRGEVVTNVNQLICAVQEYKGLLAGIMFEDAADDGNEIMMFDSEQDIYAYVKEKEDENKGEFNKWGSDPPEPGKKRKKKKKKGKKFTVSTWKEVEALVHASLKEINNLAVECMGEDFAKLFMRDVRYGWCSRPVVKSDCIVLEFFTDDEYSLVDISY